jgi:phytoene dehydrogenase-like protein
VKEFVLAAFRVATYINAPDLMSAGSAIEQLQKAFATSVLYLDEGWQTLVDGLSAAAASAGVLVETGVRVDSVTRGTSGAVSGVRLADGRAIETSTVLIASSPSAAVRLVENGDTTSIAKYADQTIPVRAACLDVALSSLPVKRATFALGIDRPLYLSVHSASARLAPDGGALIQTAQYLSPEHNDSPESVERELEGLLDLVQPGWRGVVVHRRFLPDMIVMNSMPLASFGGTRGRPGPEVADVDGLFVAGDWVGNEGLLVDASLASAKAAAESIGAAQAVSVAATA